MRSVATGWLALHADALERSCAIKQLPDTIAAPMLERYGVGYDPAGAEETDRRIGARSQTFPWLHSTVICTPRPGGQGRAGY